jgi:hypothetical protein
MSDSSLLVKRFAAAGLELEFASAPLLWPGHGESKEVFQLDVSRPNRHERFRLWSGHRENRFEVEGVDRTLQQLVMMVQEPRRRFEIAAKNLVQRNIGLAEAARIARPGRPHRADEVLVMRLPRHPEVLRIYARGRVRHADHEPVVFKHWRRVIPNNEPRAQPFGVRWID